MNKAPNADGVMNLSSLSERCAQIELLVVDVDGVLTDGGIVYSEPGIEWKKFHVRDGIAIKLWQHAGKRAAILSGRHSKLVELRAAELGLTLVVQGSVDKQPGYRRILQDTACRPEQVCYIGDDLPDLPMLLNCGLAVAVADACKEVQLAAHWVTRARGGEGAVREIVELILKSQGLWPKVIERFRGAQP